MQMPVVNDARRLIRILCGVARNPSVPMDAVRRLLRLPAAAEQIARRRVDITDDLAQAIVDLGDVRAAESLGNNDHLPTGVRWRLVTHPEPSVRASAARHAIPERVRPGCEVPAAMLTRLAEDPDPQVRARVAEHASTPEDVRARLAADVDPTVRRTIAEWWKDAPESVRRSLLTDVDADVRAAALSPWHPPPPPDLHAVLLADEFTRHLTLPHVRLAPALAAELAASPDDRVRAALAIHPDLPASTREKLTQDSDPLVRIRLVQNPTTPEAVRVRILASLEAEEGQANRFIIPYFLRNAWRDKASLGWLWEAPLDERLAYLDSPHAFFREAVAASPGLPRQAIDRLLADPDIEVRRIAAKTHDAPAQILEQLVRDHGDTMHIRPLLVERPNFPRAAFADFAVSELPRLRRLALCDKDLPANLVDLLTSDPEPHVRRAAAEHPNLTVGCLPALLTDDDLDVVEAAAAAPLLPADWINRLLTQAEL
ncbi:hypothetical protein [Phytohabitans kaempferiae]|uniref:Leucine rich repeat variant n=1 Tax=Phytohabitans kaempferiae TaxID=1620943 RepID=A0ABV6MCF0_9ACTN